MSRDEDPRAVDKPEAGFFTLRLVRGGPQVAAQIVFDPSAGWSAIINGRICGPPAADPVDAEGVFRVWHWGKFSTQQECEYLLKTARWAEKHQPSDPAANPSKSINLNTLPSVF